MNRPRLLTLLALLLLCFCFAARVVSALAQSGLGQVQYPVALDNTSSLFNLANNANTYVARTVGSADSTIYVGSAAAFPDSGALAVGTYNSAAPEIVFYSGKTSTSFTGCVRAEDGSVAFNHAIGETVSLRIDAVHINNLNAAVIALEGKVGIGSSVPASGALLTGASGGTSNWTVPGAAQVTAWLGYTPLNRTGDTMTGPLVLSGDPASSLQAATKQYVDAHSGVLSFNTRTGAITLTSDDLAAALGYVPQTPLIFGGQLVNTGGTVTCPTCENMSNKNVGNGYAGLTSVAKIPAPLGQEVWSVTDLTDYSSVSGAGTEAIRSTITAPNIGDVLTWNGTDWVNQVAPGAAGTGYGTIAEEGTALTQRNVLNFIGGAVTASDNSGAARTDVTLSESPNSASVVGTGRQILNGTGISGGGDLSADRTLSVVADSVNEQLQFLNNSGSLVGTRHAVQYLTGGALSWSLTDDGSNNKLTIAPVLSTSPAAAAAVVGTGRSLTTTSPLTGGGDLSADRTLSIGGLSSLGSGNQLVGVLGAGGGWEYKTLSGTTNQVNVAFGAGSITLSLPQSIDTGSSPTWTGLNVTGTSNLVVGSTTAISGTNAIDILVSSASTKPRLRYLSTGTGTGKWQFSNDGTTFTDFGSGGGGGITSLNSLTASSLTLVTGASGTDFNITTSSPNIVLNIPDASATARGLITTGAQTIAGNKTFSGDITFNGPSSVPTGTFHGMILQSIGGRDPITTQPGYPSIFTQSAISTAGAYNISAGGNVTHLLVNITESGTTNTTAGAFFGTATGNNSSVWGINPNVTINSGLTGASVIGDETDVTNNESDGHGLNLLLVQAGTHKGQGYLVMQTNVGTATPDVGLSFNLNGPGGPQPLSSTGTAFLINPGVITGIGLDMSGATFNTAAIKTPGFTLDALGRATSTFTSTDGGGWTLNDTQNGPISSGSVLGINYTVTGTFTATELLATPLRFSFANSITGGGSINNFRGLDLAASTFTGSSTSNLEYIYIEAGTQAGSVTTQTVGVHIVSLQKANPGWTYGIKDDSGSPWQPGTVTFTNLPTTTSNGMFMYCSDCKSVSDGSAAGSTAASGGTGAFVFRQNGAWRIHG